jgi:hypothetical protein
MHHAMHISEQKKVKKESVKKKKKLSVSLSTSGKSNPQNPQRKRLFGHSDSPPTPLSNQ